MKLTHTLGLVERHDGFWLYDYTQGMNLSMRAKTEREAFTEALTYYQNRLAKVKGDLKTIKGHVFNFMGEIENEDY